MLLILVINARHVNALFTGFELGNICCSGEFRVDSLLSMVFGKISMSLMFFQVPLGFYHFTKEEQYGI